MEKHEEPRKKREERHFEPAEGFSLEKYLRVGKSSANTEGIKKEPDDDDGTRKISKSITALYLSELFALVMLHGPARQSTVLAMGLSCIALFMCLLIQIIHYMRVQAKASLCAIALSSFFGANIWLISGTLIWFRFSVDINMPFVLVFILLLLPALIVSRKLR